MNSDVTQEQPARFQRAVRAACCDACNWPECGCGTVADIARKVVNSWNNQAVDAATQALKDSEALMSFPPSADEKTRGQVAVTVADGAVTRINVIDVPMYWYYGQFHPYPKDDKITVGAQAKQ